MFLIICRATGTGTGDVIAKAAKADISVLLTATRYVRTHRIQPVYDYLIAQWILLAKPILCYSITHKRE